MCIKHCVGLSRSSLDSMLGKFNCCISQLKSDFVDKKKGFINLYRTCAPSWSYMFKYQQLFNSKQIQYRQASTESNILESSNSSASS